MDIPLGPRDRPVLRRARAAALPQGDHRYPGAGKQSALDEAELRPSRLSVWRRPCRPGADRTLAPLPLAGDGRRNPQGRTDQSLRRGKTLLAPMPEALIAEVPAGISRRHPDA